MVLMYTGIVLLALPLFAVATASESDHHGRNLRQQIMEEAAKTDTMVEFERQLIAGGNEMPLELEKSKTATAADATKITEEERQLIIGGFSWPVTAAEYLNIPWFVLFGQGNCAGTLIHNDIVVTTAHCVDLDENGCSGCPSDVYVGPTTRPAVQGGLGLDGECINVLDCYIHPDYAKTENGNINDVALIKIGRTAAPPEQDTNPWGRFLKLNINPNLPVVNVPFSGLAIGMGRIANIEEASSDILRYIAVEFLPDCPNITDYDAQKHLCTGFTSPSEGICQGDSGGPVISETSSEELILVGLASFVNDRDNCADSKPDVFTRVSTYVDWIEKTTCENSCSKPASCTGSRSGWQVALLTARTGVSSVAVFLRGLFQDFLE